MKKESKNAGEHYYSCREYPSRSILVGAKILFLFKFNKIKFFVLYEKFMICYNDYISSRTAKKVVLFVFIVQRLGNLNGLPFFIQKGGQYKHKKNC